MKLYRLLQYILTLCVVILTALPVSAQFLRTAYFMDKSTVRTAMNPAFRPERGYFAIPALGSLNLSYGANSLAVSDILYPQDGKLVTFLDPSVSTESFLGRLKNNNQLNFDTGFGILSMGWYAGENFWTIDLGLKAMASSNIPKSLFEFMKRGSGINGTKYSITDFEIYVDSYVETAIGFSRPVNDRLTVGGKFKVLLGAANANAYFDQLNIEMNQDKWRVTSSGRMDASIKGLNPEFAEDDKSMPYINGFDIKSPGIGGFGGAIDLGASYKLLDNLTLSASVLDFGFISWSGNSTISAKANDEFIFDGFDIPVGDQTSDEGSMSDQIDAMIDGMSDLMHFRETKSSGRTKMLRTTIVFGGEYSILNNKISFGLLSTTRMFKPNPYTELTASANFRPTDWFSASLSYSLINSDFNTFGLALNFSPSWINLFIGTDYMVTKVTPQWVPIDARAANLYFGFSVPLGKQKQKYSVQY